jgi:dihydrofolate synthase/folylpolyglutamate synthase
VIDRLLALEHIGIKLGLENIGRLCRSLGHPERAFHAIHVAGTNGKGSVTAMVHEALRAAGYRSGRYTSPHLSDLRERFVIDGEPVSADLLNAAGEQVLRCAERLRESGDLQAPPTFFEATTAMAFELFRTVGVDVGVIEVGLGGRFDATNVLEPRLGAITSIGLDHQQYLGTSLSAIAREKAGIIKAGMRVVVGDMPEIAARTIRAIADEREATLLHGGGDREVDVDFEEGAAVLTVRTGRATYGPVRLGLRGMHQVGNALVAIRLLEESRVYGLEVTPSAIVAGLADANWPARLELVTWPDSTRQLLIDAAHNPDGAAALAAHLRRFASSRPPLVVGVMRDKDVTSIARALLPVTSTIVATGAPTPRAMPPDELASAVRALDSSRSVLVEPDPDAAVELAFRYSPFVCVAGSIFLAGAVRDALRRRAILR